jgi:integrase/recombinase XerD
MPRRTRAKRTNSKRTRREPIHIKNRLNESVEAPAAVGHDWTVEELDARFEEFIEYAGAVLGYSRTTLANLRTAYHSFRNFLLWQVQGRRRKLGIQLFAIDGWLAWLKDGQRCSPTAVHAYWQRIRRFFRDLEQRDGVRNPFHGAPVPPLPTRVPKALSPKDCARILDAADNYPWRSTYQRFLVTAVLGLALYAGLRRGELLSLRFANVDLEQGTLRIVGGKGRGGGKDRTGFIPPDLRKLLDRYVRERHRAGIVAPEFLCSLYSKQALPETALRRIVSKVRRASGVTFTLHVLRHSFITQLLRSGIPIHTVGAMAGHTQLSTTAGYLRVWDDDMRDAARRLRF